jgi:hypothetical protein
LPGTCPSVPDPCPDVGFVPRDANGDGGSEDIGGAMF